MLTKKLFLQLGLCLIMTIGGCVTMETRNVTTQKAIEAGYLQKAIDHEAKDEPVEALEFYNLALTMNPGDPKALAGRGRVETKLNALANVHYRKGVALKKKGKYMGARREFLVALRLAPDHKKARKHLAFSGPIGPEPFIIHVIQPGESISKLAEFYYGDPKKFDVIAVFNNLADATSVYVGQRLKVPVKPNMIIPKEMEAIQQEELLPQPPVGELPEKEEQSEDQVAFYREQGMSLFDRGKYEEAILELEKAFNANTDDSTAREYLFESHFRQGKSLFEKGNILTAEEQFKTALKYKNDCENCLAYLRKCESKYKEMHYRRGMQYFNEEQLTEAIAEWELVKARDATYKKVNAFINQATRIQTRLDELKREK